MSNVDVGGVTLATIADDDDAEADDHGRDAAEKIDEAAAAGAVEDSEEAAQGEEDPTHDAKRRREEDAEASSKACSAKMSEARAPGVPAWKHLASTNSAAELAALEKDFREACNGDNLNSAAVLALIDKMAASALYEKLAKGLSWDANAASNKILELLKALKKKAAEDAATPDDAKVAASAKKLFKKLRECYKNSYDVTTTTTLTSSSAPKEEEPLPTRLFRLVSPSSSQLKVPDQLALQIADFALRHSSAVSVATIQGGRKAVRMEGEGSAEWRKFASSRVKTYESFIADANAAILLEAAKMFPDATAISLSEDIEALVGADEMQPPHIDLAPGQIQAIVALTHSSSTMVFDVEQPSVDDAFEIAAISQDSTSRYASVLRFASGSRAAAERAPGRNAECDVPGQASPAAPQGGGGAFPHKEPASAAGAVRGASSSASRRGGGLSLVPRVSVPRRPHHCPLRPARRQT